MRPRIFSRMVIIVLLPPPCSSHVSVFPIVPCCTARLIPARMIRGPVAPIRGGPSGAGREASGRAPEAEGLPCRPRCVLAVTAGLAARDGVGPFESGRRPKALAGPSSLPHASPRTVSDNTLARWFGFSGQWRRIRTFDSQIISLMLYPLSYPWCRQRESNPRPPDYLRRSTTELGPRPIPRSGAVHRAGNAACAGGDESSNRCARSRFVTGMRAIQPATDCRKRHCGGEIVASSSGGISATAGIAWRAQR